MFFQSTVLFNLLYCTDGFPSLAAWYILVARADATELQKFGAARRTPASGPAAVRRTLGGAVSGHAFVLPGH